MAMRTFITVVFPLPKEQTEDYPARYDKENQVVLHHLYFSFMFSTTANLNQLSDDLKKNYLRLVIFLSLFPFGYCARRILLDVVRRHHQMM